ncbi:MAG: sulfatase [Mariniphaga sp.]|nr:sulfatase [Mariniphaga sp.]
MLFTTSLFFIFILLFNSCSKKIKSQKPNFIIIIVDDAAWNDSGTYGNSLIKTPNIDRLANEGLTFNNAFLTTSSCSPSRCSIITGRFPHNTGAEELHMPLPSNQLIFPGELQKAGYYTVSAGKWHLGPKRAEFDTIYDGAPSGCEFWEEALNNRPQEKPFFMWFAALDPHRDYQPNTINEPHKPDEVFVPPFLPDNDSTRKDLALYYDEISRMDSYIGKVLKILKEQNVDRNTLIIYMSDNGRPFPRSKTRLYDSGIKTPFILRWPSNIKSRLRTDALISSVDIAPTICELAGVSLPKTFQGVSFVSVLDDNQKDVRDYVAAEHNWHDYQTHERAIRNKQFLYIRNSFPEFNASPPADAVRSITYQEMIKVFNKGGLVEEFSDCFISSREPEELYDVVNDPYQMNNLALDKNFQDDLSKMRQILDKWIQETNDSIPINPSPDQFDRWSGERL